MVLAVVTDSASSPAVLKRKWVHRSIIVAASGMVVALTRFTVEWMNTIPTAERLVIVKWQTAVTLE